MFDYVSFIEMYIGSLDNVGSWVMMMLRYMAMFFGIMYVFDQEELHPLLLHTPLLQYIILTHLPQLVQLAQLLVE